MTTNRSMMALALASGMILLLALVVQTTAAPGDALRAARKAKRAELGQKAPMFTLDDVYGRSFRLEDLKDKIIVLEWFNQKCPYSHGKHKDKTMQNIYAKYAPKDVVFLAIDSTHNRTREQNRVYAARQHLNYPILHDPTGKVGKMYQARTTPHMFIIDKAGKLVYSGAIDDKGQTNYVEAALDEILAGKDVSNARNQPYGCSVKYAD